jgi:hypothetical protein
LPKKVRHGCSSYSAYARLQLAGCAAGKDEQRIVIVLVAIVMALPYNTIE